MPLATQPEVPTVAELLDKLATLGSHRQIALHLAERGINGTPCNAGSCPIAHYLQVETGNPEIHVGDDDCAVWRGGALPDERHSIPPAVKDFIAFFDAHLYPDLVDPEKPHPLQGKLCWHPSHVA